MKKNIIELFKLICMAAYFVIGLVLILESCMPGDISASQSDKVGSMISDKVQIDFGEKNEYVKPESIAFESDKTTFTDGSSYTLKVKIFPENASKTIVQYSSSDSTVASISETGQLSCKKVGQATIKAIIKDTDVQVTKQINVVEAVLSELKIEGVSSLLVVGQSIDISVKPVPCKASLGNIEWSSSDNEIVSLSSTDQTKIQINALKEGKATIKVTSSLGKSSSFNVSVVNVENPVVDVTITNEEKTIELVEGEKGKIEYNYTPLEASDPLFDFYSTNSQIVSIDGSGNFKAINNGTVKLYVQYKFNLEITDYITVNVKSREAVFELSNEVNEDGNIEMKSQTSLDIVLNKISMPSSYKITYEVGNENIAKVGATGTINAISRGTTRLTITCKSGDGTVVRKNINIVVTDEYGSNYSQFLLLVRKGVGHFLSFTIFAVAGAVFFIMCFKKKWIFLPLSLICGFTIAGITELIQLGVKGRYGCFTDVMIDFSGYFIGTIIVFVTYGLCILIRLMIKNKKGGINNEKEKKPINN